MTIRLFTCSFIMTITLLAVEENASQMLVINRTDMSKDVSLFTFKDNMYCLNASISGALTKNIIIEQTFGRMLAEIKSNDQRIFVQFCDFANIKGSVVFDGCFLPKEFDGALSPDGTMLCFSTRKSDESSVVLMDMRTSKITEIFKRKGYISPVSWSSNGTSLAFYSGESSANIDDSFDVTILNNINDKWIPRIIAPPSLLSNRSPNRSRSPVWIGNKVEFVLIEARYMASEIGSQTYLVSVNDGKLTHIDGKCGSCFPGNEQFVYVKEKNKVVSLNPISGHTEIIFTDREVTYPQLSPNGKFISFCDEKGNVVVRDISTSKEWLIGDLCATTTDRNFFWIKINDSFSQKQ